MIFGKDEFNEKTILPDDTDNTSVETNNTQSVSSDNTPEATVVFGNETCTDEQNNCDEDVLIENTVAISEPTYDDSFTNQNDSTSEYDDTAESDKEETDVEESISDRFAKVDFEDSGKKTRSKKEKTKRKRIWISAIAVALVAVILLVSLNLTAVLGFFIKNFCSDSTYFKFVEIVNFTSYSDDVTQYYKKYKELFSNKQCKNFNVSIDAKDEAIKILELFTIPQYGLGMDFINDTTIEGTVNLDKQDIHADATVKINDTEIVSGEYIKIAKDGEEYVSLPTFTDKYLMYETAPIDPMSLRVILDDEDVKKAMPSDDDLKDLALKYIKLAAKEIDNVTGSDKEVMVGNTTESVRALQFVLDTNTLNAIKKSVYTEIKQDEELKEYIDNIAKVLLKKGTIKTQDELYKTLIDSVNKDLKQIEKYQKNPVNKQIMTLVDYVNSSHEIIGRDIIIEGKTVFSILKIDDTYSISAKPVINGYECEFSGGGSLTDNVLSGEYTFSIEGDSILDISLKDVNTETALNGQLKGTLTITPKSDFWDLLPIEDISEINLAKVKMETDFAITANSVSLDNNIFVFGVQAANIKADAKAEDKSEIKKPAQDNIISGDSYGKFILSMDFGNLLESLLNSGLLNEVEDFQTFLGTLVEIGLPESVTSALDTATSLFNKFF